MVSLPSGVLLLNLLKCVLSGHKTAPRMSAHYYLGYVDARECLRCKRAFIHDYTLKIAPGHYTIGERERNLSSTFTPYYGKPGSIFTETQKEFDKKAWEKSRA